MESKLEKLEAEHGEMKRSVDGNSKRQQKDLEEAQGKCDEYETKVSQLET